MRMWKKQDSTDGARRSSRESATDKTGSPKARRLPRGLAIVYEDEDLVVVDKPAGLLTVGTEKDKTRTAYFILTDYVRKGSAQSRNRIFIVHRLDRETSGLLVFAKNAAAKLRLQREWRETEKKYLAVVHGRCARTSETITTYLAESKSRFVYSTPDAVKGKLARTSYTVVKQARDFALLEIDLLTGRKNQIRVHLAGIGHPVVGDRKYGRDKRGHGPLALHARRLSFPHPVSGKRLVFESPAPPYFRRWVGSPGAHAP